METEKKTKLTALVTGSMGAGKSAVTAYLKAKSHSVFSADAQAKKLLSSDSPCYSRLKKVFSEDFFTCSNGEFNKKRLAQEIFKRPEKKKAMERIIHPFVQKAFEKFLKEREALGRPLAFYEAPLISSSLFNRFDKKILVICPKNIKIERLIKAGWTKREVEERWAAQIPDSQMLDQADFIIDNKSDEENLRRQIDQILPLISPSPAESGAC